LHHKTENNETIQLTSEIRKTYIPNNRKRQFMAYETPISNIQKLDSVYPPFSDLHLQFSEYATDKSLSNPYFIDSVNQTKTCFMSLEHLQP